MSGLKLTIKLQIYLAKSKQTDCRFVFIAEVKLSKALLK